MPFDAVTLQLYLTAAVVLILVPGPGTLLVLGRSLALGRRAGWVTALGTAAGNVTHAALAGLGVAAVIAASPWLFDAMRLAGTAYLAWLGVRCLVGAWRTWRAGTALDLSAAPEATWPRLAVSAFVTNVANPKVIVFYLAFVPQFVDAGAGHVGLQTFVLGLILAAMALVYDLALAATASGIGRRVVRAPRLRALIDATAGVLFLAFAARLFLTDRRFA